MRGAGARQLTTGGASHNHNAWTVNSNDVWTVQLLGLEPYPSNPNCEPKHIHAPHPEVRARTASEACERTIQASLEGRTTPLPNPHS